MIGATLLIGAIGLLAGATLVVLARRLPPDEDGLASAIDERLPQTQCAQCGFPGCRPYAVAIAKGDADINLCPPGGDATIDALAELLGREPIPLDATLAVPPPNQVAIIDEQVCIGCARCLPACPVDAIVGAHTFMHTVIERECTGCELCLAPCPVDCISMVDAKGLLA